MKSDLLLALFHDIWCEGSVTIRKAKLHWMLGRVNETPSLWDSLIREWDAYSPNHSLKGALWGDTYTLSCAPIEDIRENWTSK